MDFTGSTIFKFFSHGKHLFHMNNEYASLHWNINGHGDQLADEASWCCLAECL